MISVIIPCLKKSELCPELKLIKNLIIVDDKTCSGTPGQKRNWAANQAKAKILAFIDSDAYPAKNWLKNAVKLLRQPNLAAVCGPGLTPPNDSSRQKLAGLVWSTKPGAATLTYRCRPEQPRLVDDYPSFNFIIKKKDFLKAGGFKQKFWPGEDTQLCHDLVYRLGKKILYSPEIVVYHHRRPVFKEHLQQAARYGRQRGRFVRLYPKTSLRLIYFLPLLIPLILPLYILLLTFGSFYYRSFFYAPAVLLTHLTYGVSFVKGMWFTSK